MKEKIQPIYKTFRAEIKGVDAQSGVINALIPMSTPSQDRDNEIIDPHAFKKSLTQFMKRPVLLASHNYMDLRSQIGEFKKLKTTDEGLMADGLQYYVGQGNEQADWGFNLASKGMAAFSVGFIPLKWEKIDEEIESEWGNRKFTEVELLEISQVVVPSNRDAIQGIRSKAVNDPVALALLDDIEKDIPVETVTKPEETENYFRIPVKGEAGKHDDHRIRTIDIDKDKGIKALYCGECKKVITYLFSKDDKYNWTMSSAQNWVDEHSKSAEDSHKEKKISQEQIQDDIDYLRNNIIEAGMNAETEIVALDLASEIITRYSGSDIPVDILNKVGATSAKSPEVTDPEAERRQRISDMAEVTELVLAKLKGKRIKKLNKEGN